MPNAKWCNTLTRFSKPMSEVVSSRETDFFICLTIDGSVVSLLVVVVVDVLLFEDGDVEDVGVVEDTVVVFVAGFFVVVVVVVVVGLVGAEDNLDCCC